MAAPGRASASRVLVGDIGGTNARLRLLSVNRPGSSSPRCDAERRAPGGAAAWGDVEVVHAATVPRADHDTFEGALEAFLRSSPAAAAAAGAPPRACFAGAGIVRGNRCEMTNCPWVLSGEDIAGAFGFGPVGIINDFEAVGYGVAALLRGAGGGDADLVTLLEGEPEASGPVLVMGARRTRPGRAHARARGTFGSSFHS